MIRLQRSYPHLIRGMGPPGAPRLAATDCKTGLRPWTVRVPGRTGWAEPVAGGCSAEAPVGIPGGALIRGWVAGATVQGQSPVLQSGLSARVSGRVAPPICPKAAVVQYGQYGIMAVFVSRSCLV